MKTLWKLTALLLSLALAAGCAASSSSEETNTVSSTESIATLNEAEMFTERDRETAFDLAQCVTVELKDQATICTDASVRVTGNNVVLTGDKTYYLSGTLTNGSLTVQASDTAKPRLIFDGVTVTAAEQAPLTVVSADKVLITLAPDSVNRLENQQGFADAVDADTDGAVFSRQDLTINGGGALTVTSPVGHAITCKDDLVVVGGNYTLQSAGHGLDANDSIRIAHGTFTVNAGKDGIHAENNDDASLGYVYVADMTVSGQVQGDGISAASTLWIKQGTVTLTAGGGHENGQKASSEQYGGFMGGMPHGMRPTAGMSQAETTTDEAATSMKGLKAGTTLQIDGGTFSLDTADDSLHTNGTAAIHGGTFTLRSGDDGIHADSALDIYDGAVTIETAYEGLEALTVTLHGGNITMNTTDDGINAAGGNDQSGYGGRDEAPFGGPHGGMGGPGGGGASNGKVIINGGTVYIQMKGDGIDANGLIEMTGGHVTVCGPTTGDTAVLDYDTSATISGGTFIGTGAYQMAQTFSDTKQPMLAVSVGNQSAQTKVTVTNAKGQTLLSYAPALDYAILLFSSPDLKTGDTVTLQIGSASEEFTIS